MKKKSKKKVKRDAKRSQPVDKSSLLALSEYFGSYLTALEIVSARQ